MKAKNFNLQWVGDLQIYGLPFSSVYVDGEERQSYLFVRLSTFDQTTAPNWLAMKVSPKEISDYMQGIVGLTDMIVTNEGMLGVITNGRYVHNYTPTSDNIERIKKMNYFDSEFCNDETWIEIFVDRLKNNRPLITSA